MNTILIWGTGARADALMELIDLQKCTIQGFIDSNPEKHGTVFHGRPVHGPETLASADFDALIIASAYSAEILPHACSLGLGETQVHLFSRTNPFFTERFCRDDLLAFDDDLKRAEAVSWHHRFEIAPGFTTDGQSPFEQAKLNYFEAMDDPKGRTVLDIGAWDGPYTFEMERRGARVTAFDIQDPNNSGFNVAKRLLGSEARHVRDNVYNLRPETHGTYDIVLFLGVWYHLKNPLQALSNIHGVLNPGGLLVFEGAILDHAYNVDDYWNGNRKLLDSITETSTSFYVADRYENDDSNWTIPTKRCLEDWLSSSGFELLALDIKESHSRAGGAARRIDNFFRAEHALV